MNSAFWDRQPIVILFVRACFRWIGKRSYWGKIRVESTAEWMYMMVRCVSILTLTVTVGLTVGFETFHVHQIRQLPLPKSPPEIRLRCSRKISSRDWLAWSSSLMVCGQSSQTSPMVWCHWRTASLRPCFSSTPLDWPPTCQACVEHRGCCDLSATC